MAPGRDRRSAAPRREREPLLWYRGGEPPAEHDPPPRRSLFDDPEPAPPPRDGRAAAPAPPPRRDRPARATRAIAAVALALAAAAGVVAAVAILSAIDDDSPSATVAGGGVPAEQAVRDVVLRYGHASTPEAGCPLFSRALASERFGSPQECLLSGGSWRYDDTKVDSVTVDGDRAVAYGASALGDRFRYELVREGGAWRLAELREPERDARETAEGWATATGPDLCDYLTDRLARTLYGSPERCLLTADALPATLAVTSVDITPHDLDSPTRGATVGARLSGRAIRLDIRFTGNPEQARVDDVVDARTGAPVKR